MAPIIRIKPKVTIPKAIIVAGGMGGRFGGLTDRVHKAVLPVAGMPNIDGLAKKLKEYLVKDVYISAHYRPLDIKEEVGYGQKYGSEFNVHYNYEATLNNTASAARNIVFGKYKEDFKKEKYVWVLACDIGFPGADLGAFKRGFLNAVANGGKDRHGKPNIVGGIGFVVRPCEDFLRMRPTAVINKDNLITKWVFNPVITKYGQEDSIREQITSKDIAEFENKTKLKGMPFPTFFYILSREALEAVSKIKDRNPSDIDFTTHLFRHFPNRLWAHFFKEEDIDGKLLRQYYDFNTPVDYYRAQWQFIRTANKIMSDNYTYYPTINSYLGRDTVGVKMDKYNVTNCVVDDYANIMKGCSIENSIIGKECIIRNAVIKNSLILPNTLINYHPTKDEAPVEIANSIVGAGGRYQTFFDHVHSPTMQITGKLAVPDDRMQIRLSDLGINEADVKMCEEAFSVQLELNKKE